MTGLATDVFVAGFDAEWWRVAWRLGFAARLCETARDDVWVTGRDGVVARVVVTGALETGALGRTVEDGAGVEGRGAGAGGVYCFCGAGFAEDGAGSGAGDTGSGAGSLAAGVLSAAGAAVLVSAGSCACAKAGEKSRQSSSVAAAHVAPSPISRIHPRQDRSPPGAASPIPKGLAPILHLPSCRGATVRRSPDRVNERMPGVDERVIFRRGRPDL